MTTINLYENSTTCISTNITKETTSNLDTCTVEVPYSYTIAIGDELNVYDDTSTLIFKGLVQNIKISGLKEVLAYDYGIQLMDINVNDIYSSYKAEDIIEDIVTKYTDLTYVSTIVTSATITSFIIKDKGGWDVVNELAELLNASFRVDKNKNFYLEMIEEDTSTEIITSENAVIDEDWTQNSDSLINKVTIIGDKQLFEKSQKFSGTGSQTTFTLTEFPVDTNVTVGGVEQVGYVKGATSSADYSVEKGTKNIVFTTGSIPASGTDNIIVRYTFSIDIKLVSQDDVSIEAYGGPNKIPKEKKITKSYISSFQEARNFANFYLGIYAQPLLKSTWIINDYTKFESFVPNQQISVTDSIRGISDTFIIKKVEREFPGQLTVELGWKEDTILDWNKEVQYRIKQLEEIDDNSTILHEYGFIENKVELQVVTAVERELYRILPDNYMYFANPIDGIDGWWKLNGTVQDWNGNNNGTIVTLFPNTEGQYKLNDDLLDSGGNSFDATNGGTLSEYPAHYKFNSDATDSSGNSNDLTATDITYTTGKIGNCASFNGTSSYGQKTSFSLSTNSQQTITGWINPNDLSSNRSIVSYNGYTDITILSDGRLMVGLIGSSAGMRYYSTNTISTSTWTHIAIKLSGKTATNESRYTTEVEMYINGVKETITTATIGASTTTSHILNIGCYQPGTNHFSGLMDDIRFYSFLLREDEILDIYNSSSGTENEFVYADYEEGIVGNAYRIKGITNWLSLGTVTTPSEYLYDYTTDFSYGLWLKPENVGRSSIGVMGRQFNHAIYISPLSTGLFHISVGVRSGASETITVALNTSINEWYHVYLTYNASTRLLSGYLNGELIGTRTITNNFVSTSSNFTLGASAVIGGNNTYFNGLMDDVRVYSSTLNDLQVKAIYNEGIGTEESPVHYNVGKQFDNALVCDGTTYISLPQKTIDKDNGSISLWLYFRDYILGNYSGKNTIIGTYANAPYNKSLYVSGGIEPFDLQGETNLNGELFVDKSSIIYKNIWYNIICNFDNGECTTYLNNILIDTKTVTNNFDIDSIGGGFSGTSSVYINAKIGDFRTYTKPLSEDERTSIYNSGLGLTSNANIAEIGGGEDRPWRNEGDTELFFITDKDYWATPDYEIDATGSLQSWNLIVLLIGNYTINGTVVLDGSSAYFDGNNNNYISLDDKPDSQIGTKDFKISFSGKTLSQAISPGTRAYSAIFASINISIFCGYSTIITPNGFRFQEGNGGNAVSITNSKVTDNIWHRWVCERNDGNLNIYCDDVLLGTTTAAQTNLIDTTGGHYIGCNYLNTTSQNLMGNIKDFVFEIDGVVIFSNDSFEN